MSTTQSGTMVCSASKTRLEYLEQNHFQMKKIIYLFCLCLYVTGAQAQRWYLPTGQLIKKQSVAYSKKITLDCSDLTHSNLYFLRVRANQNKMGVFRLYKSN
jgi:hypothetical protein